MKSSKKVFGKDTNHVRHIHIAAKRDRDNNNKMERLNGEIRDREKVFRGLKKMDTGVLGRNESVLQLHQEAFRDRWNDSGPSFFDRSRRQESMEDYHSECEPSQGKFSITSHKVEAVV